jgi:hypothetical protein
MPKGISLHIGVDKVNPAAYDGLWAGALKVCKEDARAMRLLAREAGFETSDPLLDEKAKLEPVRNAIKRAVTRLDSNGIFLLTYSGHGGQVDDTNRDEGEPDKFDETWALYDGQLVDDEIYNLLHGFKPTQRVIVISDSCHSGTITNLPFFAASSARNFIEVNAQNVPVTSRLMPQDVVAVSYKKNREYFRNVQARNKKGDDYVIAQSLLISACQDRGLAYEGDFFGIFTGCLLSIWNGGAYSGSYRDFFEKVAALVKTRSRRPQLPNFKASPNFIEADQPLGINR